MQRVVGLVPFYWLITTVHCKGRSLLSSNNLIEHVINFDMLLVVTISSLFEILFLLFSNFCEMKGFS